MIDNLKKIKKQIVANGVLSVEDVNLLRAALYEDGKITREKSDFLFDFKDMVNKDRVVPDFAELFIEAISSYLLEDEDSPGEIDDKEAKWLRAKIQKKGFYDKIDRKLIENLKKKAINFPEILNHKNKASRAFESVLYISRYLTILAVIGSILSSIALFLKGSYLVIQTLIKFYERLNFTDGEEYEKLLADFVTSVDLYLFAMVLIIFGMGIYELFINKIDPVERKTDARPSWLQITSIDELKSSLGKVILMILIVSFFKHSIEINYENTKDLLYLALGVIMIALSLYIANKHSNGKKLINEKDKIHKTSTRP